MKEPVGNVSNSSWGDTGLTSFMWMIHKWHFCHPDHLPPCPYPFVPSRTMRGDSEVPLVAPSEGNKFILQTWLWLCHALHGGHVLGIPLSVRNGPQGFLHRSPCVFLPSFHHSLLLLPGQLRRFLCWSPLSLALVPSVYIYIVPIRWTSAVTSC